MKQKKRYVCKECGCISNSWLGKCPECNSWSSFIEELIEDIKFVQKTNGLTTKPVKIQEIETTESDVILLNSNELNIFFGEGIVIGSVILLAGEPGIGKSTFLFYVSNNVSKKNKVYYFSGEESDKQIKKRFDRVGNNDSPIYLSNCADIDGIIDIAQKESPSIIYIDSIQTIYSKQIDSSPGTISQIKKCTQELVDLAKRTGIIICIVCHVTKSGDIAGPKVMEHMVDVVVYFESDFKNQYRVLRSRKNRFGSIDEILFFEMESDGLHLITNPSTFFLESDTDESVNGKCKSVIIEGKIPVIVDVEALVVPSSYPNPRRFSEGIDLSRLNRIIAILDKHLNENLNNYDVYLNIAGGIKTTDVGIDLAVAAAIYSSKNKITINSSYIFIGELSLTGQLKKVFKNENRQKEALKFGYTNIISRNDENNMSVDVKIIKEVVS